MSLDLLKERFGHSISTNKKEVDKKKLNEMFNSNSMDGLKDFKVQHQKELDEKTRGNQVNENISRETNQVKRDDSENKKEIASKNANKRN